jgi:nucleoid DNA-binding protein/nucleoside diphosphate kinase
MIEQYISDLLYRYESVILPGFGAFILKYTPASINPDNNITHPSKHIVFDPYSQNNDGILANYISEKERISFFDACNKIRAFTEEIKKSLSEKKLIVLKEIGIFANAADNSIYFSPDISVDYNLDTYGMGEVMNPPIARNDKKIKLDDQYSAITPTLKGKRYLSNVSIWIVCIAVFLGILVTLMIIKPDFISHNIISHIYRSKENKTITEIHKQNKKENLSIIKEKAILSDSIKEQDTVSKIANKTTVNINEQTATEKYYIISASFRIKENAINYAQTLKQKSYNSDVIFLEDRGLYVVSYNAYSSEADAEQALTKIKFENSVAWILKH